MSETVLPNDLLAQIAAIRAQQDARPRNIDSTTTTIEATPARPMLERFVGRLCTWADTIGKRAAERGVPTNINIVDAIRPDNPGATRILGSGWKITLDPHISGGGSLSFIYSENPPITSTRGVMLVRGETNRLAAFKAAADIDYSDASVVSAQEGLSQFGDGFDGSNIAYIDKETFPLPIFLDTWNDETGLIVLEHDLVAFAHQHNLDR